MRTLFVSSILALALVCVPWLDLFSQQAGIPQTGHAGDTQVMSVLLPNGVHQMVVFDARQQALAVYHIEPGSGKIQLKSVRKVQMDLAIEQFNAVEPLPSEMRLLKQP